MAPDTGRNRRVGAVVERADVTETGREKEREVLNVDRYHMIE